MFLAVHVPGRAVTFPAGMTLVNLYPLILREALNAEVVDLPDRTIFASFSVPTDSRKSGQRRGDCLVRGIGTIDVLPSEQLEDSDIERPRRILRHEVGDELPQPRIVPFHGPRELAGERIPMEYPNGRP